LATSRGRLPAALLCLLSAAAPGCRRDGPPPAATPIAVTDDAGRALRLARPAERVVALVPSVNETLLALGAGRRIVARSDYDHAPELARLPSVGGGLTPNVEWLAANRPDLVVAWPDERSRAVVDRLETVGVPVYAARVETLADADRTTRNLGTLLGLRAAADTLVARLHGRLDAVRRRAAAQPAPRVLYLIGLDPPEVAGGGTFVDELLRIAGGRNVFGDLRLWPTVGLEEIVRRDADVVILAVSGQRGDGADAAARLRATPGWSGLRAVRSGRVVALDPDLVNRPGPRSGEAAEQLFAALHPGATAQTPGAGRTDTATRRHGDTASRATSGMPGSADTGVSKATADAGGRTVAASPRRRVTASAGRRP
jgi:iron complex transport system substrate-binding protein